MTNDDIFRKYWRELEAIASEEMAVDVSDAAVALALRLAIADGVTLGQQVAIAAASALQERLERKNDLLLELQATLDAALSDANGLRQQVVQMDADAAALLARVQELEAWKTVAIACNGTPNSSPIPASTDSGAPAAGVTSPAPDAAGPMAAPPPPSNGVWVAPNSASSVSTNGSSSQPWWHGLDEETNDWRISLEAKRRTFRNVPKTARLLLVQAFLRAVAPRNGTTTEMPTMADFDAHRPEWMPTAAGLAKTFGCPWGELLTLREVAEP